MPEVEVTTAPRVLVVCHANVTRSVAAAHLLAAAIERLGGSVEVRTAGTHALDGQPVSRRTLDALRSTAGTIDLSSHRSRPLGDGDVAWADLVLAMEASQVRLVRARHPAAAGRAATLAHAAAHLPAGGRPLGERVAAMRLDEVDVDDADDVADPAGGGDEEYVAAMRVLAAHCGELAARLLGARPAGPTMPPWRSPTRSSS